MTSELKIITLVQGRQIAEDAVVRDKSYYENSELDRALEGDFLEAEHCWIFFRSKTIVVSKKNWFTKSYAAFTVSKKGAISQITAFEEDRAQLLDSLQTMSDYFGRRGE